MMKSKVHELTELLPPPSEPRNNLGDWSQIEANLGTALPQDFKDFTHIYGTVVICNYLFIHTPFPAYDGYGKFLQSLSREYDAVVGGRNLITYPLYPEECGILGIGGTDSADVISWITDGHPDEWGIFFWKWPGLKVATFKDLNLTGFLVDLLSMKSPLFPNKMPETFFSPEQRGVEITN